ncbi:MAG: FkbM family methyltransferase [Firmicutes bacterium]|nr:FkbM family methyltransferase [Bacillota bacterium]
MNKNMEKIIRHASNRLQEISSPQDAWAFVVRTATFLANLTGKNFEPLKNYDTKTTGKFAQRKLAKYHSGESYNFGGIYLPTLATDDYGNLSELYSCVKDILGVYLNNNDDYSKSYVDELEKQLIEGVYCYSDAAKNCNITIKQNDTVLDLGAWIGVFSAYASKKGANVYAFEPMQETREILAKTVQLNNSDKSNKSHESNKGNIKIVPFGVGDVNQILEFYHYHGHSASSTFSVDNASVNSTLAQAKIVRLDDWVKEENISKIDFIKADIEGFERNMLIGATNILKTHQPLLSLCTYHKPDDPQVMKEIILAANPNYRIIQRRMKMFGYIEI